MTPEESPTCVFLFSLTTLVLVAGGGWLIWRKMFGRTTLTDYAEPSTASKMPDSSAISEPELQPRVKIVESLGIDQTDRSSLALLALQAERITEPALREFLSVLVAKVSETGPRFDEETPFRFIEEIVDRLDDLLAIATNHSSETAKDIDSFRQMLLRVLSKCGAELIHSEIWDPALQRAIAKNPTDGLTAPSIIRFGSSGIRRHGQLIRKQEVVIGIPETKS